MSSIYLRYADFHNAALNSIRSINQVMHMYMGVYAYYELIYKKTIMSRSKYENCILSLTTEFT